MSVGYILRKVGRKLGLNPQDPESRLYMLDLLNEGAREVYMQSDAVGSVMEMVFKVNGDQTVTLPWYVGRIRAMRENCSMQVWHVNQMRPRYNQFNWQDQWRNWRLRNRQALQATVTNQSVGVLTVTVVEDPPIVVTLKGPISTAQSVVEQVTMDALTKNSVNQFLTYTAIQKDRPNNCDVTLSDVDGNVLSVIPNTEFKAEYQVIDVSSCPWLPTNQSPRDNYMEVLYKVTLPILWNDGDEFPANDYDDILVNKVLQLNAEEQGKVDIASAYDAKATRTEARLADDQNAATEDMVSLVANPHDTIHRKIGYGLRRRFSFYANRKL